MAVESNLTFELIWAASAGDLLEIKRVVALGVNINNKRTALHLAAAEGHEDIVKYLIRKGVNVNATQTDGVKNQ